MAIICVYRHAINSVWFVEDTLNSTRDANYQCHRKQQSFLSHLTSANWNLMGCYDLIYFAHFSFALWPADCKKLILSNQCIKNYILVLRGFWSFNLFTDFPGTLRVRSPLHRSIPLTTVKMWSKGISLQQKLCYNGQSRWVELGALISWLEI